MFENSTLIPLVRFNRTRTQEGSELCLSTFFDYFRTLVETVWAVCLEWSRNKANYGNKKGDTIFLRSKSHLVQLRCENHDQSLQDFNTLSLDGPNTLQL